MRISTTTIESFRLFRRGRIDEANLIATIKGEFIPTPRVILGQAYDRILEDPDRYRVPDGYACDAHRFEADVVDPALATIDRRGLFQVKATKQYGEDVVVAKADYILGAELEEFKTRIGGYHFDRYAESCQWRFELDLFAGEAITYKVFLLGQDPIALKAIEQLRLYPYQQLTAECHELVDRFAAFVRRRGLEWYLQPRFEDAPSRPSPMHRFRQLREQLREKFTGSSTTRSAVGAPRSCRSERPGLPEDKLEPDAAGQVTDHDREPGSIPGLRSTSSLQPLQPIVELPPTSLVLWPSRPSLRQPSLF